MAVQGLSRRQERAAWYLAGIIDGEGNVQVKLKDNGKLERGKVRISNTDRSIVDAIEFAFEELDIAFVTTGPHLIRPEWSPFWEVTVGRRDEIEKIAKLVPVQAQSKIDALRTIVSAGRQVYGSDIMDVDDVYLMYWDSEMSAEEIAVDYGVDKKQVLYFMDKNDIPRRSKSEAATLSRRG